MTFLYTLLDRIGISLDRIRSEVERQAVRGQGRRGKDMQLTPDAKKVIDRSYQESRLLCNDYIGTEHLLLGLIGDQKGVAGRVLAQVGITSERARAEVVHLQGGPSAAVPKKPGLWSRILGK